MTIISRSTIILYDHHDHPICLPHHAAGLFNAVPQSSSFITSGRFGAGEQPSAAVGDLVPIGATFVAGDYALKVDVQGGVGSTPDNPVRTEETRPTTAAVTRIVGIAGSPTSTAVLSANLSRRGVILFNEGATPLFVKLGAAATTVDYTLRMDTSAVFVLPVPVYTGPIEVTAAVGGAGPLQVTEMQAPSA